MEASKGSFQKKIKSVDFPPYFIIFFNITFQIKLDSKVAPSC